MTSTIAVVVLHMTMSYRIILPSESVYLEKKNPDEPFSKSRNINVTHCWESQPIKFDSLQGQILLFTLFQDRRTRNNFVLPYQVNIWMYIIRLSGFCEHAQMDLLLVLSVNNLEYSSWCSKVNPLILTATKNSQTILMKSCREKHSMRNIWWRNINQKLTNNSSSNIL